MRGEERGKEGRGEERRVEEKRRKERKGKGRGDRRQLQLKIACVIQQNSV